MSHLFVHLLTALCGHIMLIYFQVQPQLKAAKSFGLEKVPGIESTYACGQAQQTSGGGLMIHIGPTTISAPSYHNGRLLYHLDATFDSPIQYLGVD